MAGPWEKYSAPAAESGPWAKYAQPTADAAVAEEAAPEAAVGNAIKNVYGGIYEPLLQTGSSMVAAPVAGLAGMGARALEGAGLLPQNAGADTVEGVQRAMTYEPRTAGGKRVSQTIAYPMEKYAQLADRAGDTLNAPDTRRPKISVAAANYGLDPIRKVDPGSIGERAAAATIVNTAIQAAPAIFLKGRGKSGGVAGDVTRAPSVGRAPGVPKAPEAAPSNAPQRPARLARVSEDVPSKEALKKASQDAYKRARDTGAVIKPESFQQAQQSITKMLKEEGLDPTLHPSATAALKRISEKEGAVSLEELETLRKIAKDAEGALAPADKRLAAKTVEALDDYAESLDPRHLSAGTPEAVAAYKEARGLWSRARKAETIDEMVDRAQTRARAHYTQAGMEHAVRQEFKTLALNAKRLRMFTKQEQAAIKQIARGGAWENALRNLGKFDPTSGGMAAFMSTLLAGGGAVATSGASLLLPVAGFAAKRGATRITAGKVARLDEMVRRGPNALADKKPVNALRQGAPH